MKRLKDNDALSAPEFLGRNPPAHETIRVTYRCGRCGRKVETGIRTDAVSCTKCGTRMRPTA